MKITFGLLYSDFLPGEKQWFYKVLWVLKDGVDFLIPLDIMREIMSFYLQLWSMNHIRIKCSGDCDSLEPIRYYTPGNTSSLLFNQLTLEYREYQWNKIEQSHQKIMEKSTKDYDKDFMVVIKINSEYKISKIDFFPSFLWCPKLPQLKQLELFLFL